MTHSLFYECPLEDPDYLEVWCYTDRLSYCPGEEVHLHASSTAETFSVTITRDGAPPATVHQEGGLRAPCTALPPDFIERGCRWPVVWTWTVPESSLSGFYLIRVSAENAAGVKREHEHGFFVLADGRNVRGDALLIAATSTWIAYNDWGGANGYQGEKVPEGYHFAPRLTIHRPFARGLIWTPEGAPRKPHEFEVAPHAVPRYPPIEWAYARGFSKWYANAGWATYERHFAIWAETNGYKLDYACQHDLHFQPNILKNYRCVILIGHDEYWTWEMREAIDAFVAGGGNVARFAGNLLWQIRLEDGGATQVCYKELAGTKDPLCGITPRRTTSIWSDPAVGWPGAQTFGLNAEYGGYAHVGSLTPRSSGGFTVYRPEHWAFLNTDLYYGDIFGAEARILGYEVDGLDYTFKNGRPYPTFADGAPETVEILAMGLASTTETMRGRRGEASYYGDSAATFATIRYGSAEGEFLGAGSHGAGMIACFTRGAGTVFHAGSCEWVNGLKRREFFTETITRNVLNRFMGKVI